MSHFENASQKTDDELSYRTAALNLAAKVSLAQLILISCTTWFVASNFLPSFDGVKASSVGHRSIFEPSFLVRLRFALGAFAQITDGYRLVLSSPT